MYDVHCMSCKQLWEDAHVRDQVPMSVIKRLTAATKKRLRDEETAFMPETQMYIEYGRAVNTVKVNTYLNVMREIHDIEFQIAKEEIVVTKNMRKRGEKQERKNALKRDIDLKKSELWKLKHRIQMWRRSRRYSLCIHFKDIMPEPLYRKHFMNNNNQTDDTESSKRGTIEPLILCPCPADQCRGFVTRKGHKCGVCDQQVCGTCLMKLDSHKDPTTTTTTTTTTSHECKETDVQSAELILKSSKPCPKCATRIHKIDGCDQMWCTQCNTPFSWRSGRESVGQVIHNPHFYEWMRNRTTTTANDNDTPHHHHGRNNCEGMPEIHTLSRHTGIVFGRNSRFTDKIRSVHRRCVHFREVEIRARTTPANQQQHEQRNRYEFYQPNNDTNSRFRENMDIRMKWMNNESTEKAFESVLHKRYKQKLVNQRIVQVYDLVITLCADVFHRLLRTNEDTEAIRNDFLTEFDEITTYSNTCFEKLEKVYQQRMPRVEFS